MKKKLHKNQSKEKKERINTKVLKKKQVKTLFCFIFFDNDKNNFQDLCLSRLIFHQLFWKRKINHDRRKKNTRYKKQKNKKR
jgi:hypothetical protein